jgi:metal-responsive CopG/Arc/MetJ family transcriptional regulator
METISLKMDGKILKEMDRNLSKYRYSTRTEFIRDAIRSKLTELEKKEMIQALKEVKGVFKKKTTDEQLHKIREELAKKHERKFS